MGCRGVDLAWPAAAPMTALLRSPPAPRMPGRCAPVLPTPMQPPIRAISIIAFTSVKRMSSRAALVSAPVHTSLRAARLRSSARHGQRGISRRACRRLQASPGARQLASVRSPDPLRLRQLLLLVPGAANRLVHRYDRLDRRGLLLRGRQQGPPLGPIQPRVAVDLGAQDRRGPDQRLGLPRMHLCARSITSVCHLRSGHAGGADLCQ